MNKARSTSIVNKFPGTRVLVVGDLMLDTFIWGEVSRISPEAPVPVIEKTSESSVPGGSGNVVKNLHALGADVYVIGVIGDDAPGKVLMRDFSSHKIHIEGVCVDSRRPTITKTRIIARNQQVLRLDVEKTQMHKNNIERMLVRNIERSLPRCKVVIISDYGKGVISKTILKKIITSAKKCHIPVMVDPKIEHFKQYRGVTCITPNIHEARQGMSWFDVRTQADLKKLGAEILKKLNCTSVLITNSEKGMDLFETHKRPIHIPVTAKEVFDVTGAGDTVISVLALGVSCGADLFTAALLSTCAAGCVVGKVGTASISRKELLDIIAAS